MMVETVKVDRDGICVLVNKSDYDEKTEKLWGEAAKKEAAKPARQPVKIKK